jgi:hypothetical protein
MATYPTRLAPPERWRHVRASLPHPPEQQIKHTVQYRYLRQLLYAVYDKS